MSTEELTLLRSIDATLKELLTLSKTKRAATPQPAAQTATDADLDSTHGDPIVKFMPRDWTGDEFRQQPFSATTPEFLDMLADSYDYFARKNEEDSSNQESKKKTFYDKLNAKRARGWAARLRAGWKSPMNDANPWQDKEKEKW
jgi:ribosomal protein S21